MNPVSRPLDQTKVTIKEVAQTIKNEALDAKHAIFVPLKTSLDYKIEDLEKPTAVYLFNEDFSANNALEFNTKVSGPWTAKINTSVGINGTADNITPAWVDDAQLNGPIGKAATLQLKFKPRLVSAQVDFGLNRFYQHYQSAKRSATFVEYYNPYVYYEVDRAWASQTLGLGLLFHLDKILRVNARFNVHKKEGGWDWDIQKNTLYKYHGFFANSAIAMTFNKWLEFKSRRFMVGYDRDQINANVELGVDKGSYADWDVRSLLASFSYDLREKGLFGLQFDLTPNALRKENLSQLLTFGYRNKLHKDLEFKTRISLKRASSFFFNYRLGPGLSFQTTFSSSLVNKHKNGFLDYPFDLNLKLKLER